MLRGRVLDVLEGKVTFRTPSGDHTYFFPTEFTFWEERLQECVGRTAMYAVGRDATITDLCLPNTLRYSLSGRTDCGGIEGCGTVSTARAYLSEIAFVDRIGNQWASLDARENTPCQWVGFCLPFITLQGPPPGELYDVIVYRTDYETFVVAITDPITGIDHTCDALLDHIHLPLDEIRYSYPRPLVIEPNDTLKLEDVLYDLGNAIKKVTNNNEKLELIAVMKSFARLISSKVPKV